jgi:hypothetical protein
MDFGSYQTARSWLPMICRRTTSPCSSASTVRHAAIARQSAVIDNRDLPGRRAAGKTKVAPTVESGRGKGQGAASGSAQVRRGGGDLGQEFSRLSAKTSSSCRGQDRRSVRLRRARCRQPQAEGLAIIEHVVRSSQPPTAPWWPNRARLTVVITSKAVALRGRRYATVVFSRCFRIVGRAQLHLVASALPQDRWAGEW